MWVFSEKLTLSANNGSVFQKNLVYQTEKPTLSEINLLYIIIVTTACHKRLRAKMQPIFESFPGPLLKSGMRPLARYGNHQEIILSRRLEQMYTSSDTRLEWPRKGPLFESDSNARGPKWDHYLSLSPRPLLKSGLQPLFKYGTYQTISGRLEQVYHPCVGHYLCQAWGRWPDKAAV